jgi:hypothetical protein
MKRCQRSYFAQAATEHRTASMKVSDVVSWENAAERSPWRYPWTSAESRVQRGREREREREETFAHHIRRKGRRGWFSG